MIVRRIGLVLATVPAVLIEPEPSTGTIGVLPVAVGALSTSVALATLALLVPAWRGGRRSALAISILQLVCIAPALPAFLVPADVVPPGAVVVASVSCLLNVTAVGLITVDRTSLLLVAAAVAAVLALSAAGGALLALLAPESATRGGQALLTVGAALAFHPLLTLLRRTVGGSLYGGRVDPARTAQHLGALGESTDLLNETARALRLPRLELLDRGRSLAVSGSAAPGSHEVEIPADAEGRLVLRVGLRPGLRRLHPDERVTLGLVARPLGMLVRENELATELRAARAAAAESREAERATVHRELHDGVGPLLTGAAFRLDAAARHLEAPDPARIQLDAARDDLRAAIVEVRRVVHGLRPLELEQRGLWNALAARAAATDAALSLPEPRPELSAAVDLALYRIVAEALANAERHAPGRRSRVEVEADPTKVRLEIWTEGVTTGSAPSGIGIRSMRARAEELGGVATIGPEPDGWRVLVEIPRRDP